MESLNIIEENVFVFKWIACTIIRIISLICIIPIEKKKKKKDIHICILFLYKFFFLQIFVQ